METEDNNQPACDDTGGDFRKAETIAPDTRVRQIAIELGDTKLLDKLSVGDMIAIDVVYHLKCSTSFYNKHRSQHRRFIDECRRITTWSLALAGIVSYIEENGQYDED